MSYFHHVILVLGPAHGPIMRAGISTQGGAHALLYLAHT